MPSLTYQTLDLALEHSSENYRAHVLDSPAGQANANFVSPFTSAELTTFLARVGRRAPIVGTGVKPEEMIKDFGTRLFNAVFHDEVVTCYRRSRDAANNAKQGLRVCLRLNDVPELADLPWEYLYDASRQEFLALSKETPVVRYLELPEPLKPLAAPAPLNLLAVLASPTDFEPLDMELAWKNLNDALASLRAQNKITIERVTPPTLDALRTALRRNAFHVLHFVGHGIFNKTNQQGALVLEDDQRKGRPVSDDRVATLLNDHESLRLVLMDACEGARTSADNPFAGVAPRLVQRGIPAVMAMQFPVTDTSAILFSTEFYRTLADGYPVDAAVNEARRAIYLDDNNVVEWGTPVLFMRAADGMIFQKEEAMPDEKSEKPKGGINISGGTIHVGGDMVAGDKVVHGDEIHAGGDVNTVTIGAGASVGQVAAGSNITQTQGASAQDLAVLFNAIYKQIDARANDPNVERGEIRDTVKNIESEVAKGDTANPTKVERWLKFLKDIAPDILEVTANAILNPVAGVTTAIKKIAEKMRAS
ncbi:MAG: CHAT domain-containing protein [Chloroflexota bacterium]|nr:MAG: CHAT domain-containing protein [Chloroflexota bacterium]